MTRNRLLVGVVLFAVLCSAATAYATNYATANFYIAGIGCQSGLSTCWIKTGFVVNNTNSACTGKSEFRFDSSTQWGKNILSQTTAAFLAGKQVMMVYTNDASGCLGASGYPTFDQFYVLP